MTPIAQLIAELREAAAERACYREIRASLLTRAAEALARQEELLAEAGKVVEPFAAKLVDIGSDEEDEDGFREMSFANRRAKPITVGHFRAAARLSDKLKGE